MLDTNTKVEPQYEEQIIDHNHNENSGNVCTLDTNTKVEPQYEQIIDHNPIKFITRYSYPKSKRNAIPAVPVLQQPILQQPVLQ